MIREIAYFEEMGKANTERTLALAKKRALELGLSKVLVASTHGFTALAAAQAFGDTGIEVIAVSISDGFDDMGWCMTDDERAAIERAGVRVLTAQHSLSGGVDESFSASSSPQSVISNTLYCFSQGMKVAVEIAIMAVEAGLIDAKAEALSIGGTGEGADTAIVLIPAVARKFTDLRVLEILCKPRIG